MPQSDPLNVNESVSSPALCRCKWVCMCMCVCVWPVRSCQQNIETHLQANVGHACCESCQELLQQQPKQKVPTTCCCCQVLFIVFLIPSRSPCCYACRRLFVLGDFALLCLCCSSSYLRTAWRVCVCGSCCYVCVCLRTLLAKLCQYRNIHQPNYVYFCIYCCYCYCCRSVQQDTLLPAALAPRPSPGPGPRTDKQSASKCDDSRRRWATTIPKATEQKTLQSHSQSQSQSQSQQQYNFALIMYRKHAKYRNVCCGWSLTNT